MNQVFRITVGPETIEGRLPARRVGLNYNCRFHVAGVPADAAAAPKIWITTSDGTLGVWVVDVNTDASQVAGSYLYALTLCDDSATEEYIAGQGAFTVYTTIASGGETGGTAGESVLALITALESRVETIEARLTEFAQLEMFDPLAARDIEMREQVQTITNLLRGETA